MVIPRPAHLDERKKKSGRGRKEGEGRRWKKRRKGRETPIYIFRKVQTHVCTQSQIRIH